MPECTYCDESFPDEAAYVAHLADTHEGELSRIDRRRIEGHREGSDRSRAVVYAAVAVLLALLGAAVYVTVFAGGGDATGLEARPLPEQGDAARLEAVETFPSAGRNHVPSGTEIDYARTPPTSGPHYGSATDPGFYEEAQPAGELVHALEHGAVVIYYDPAALTPAAEESLRAFAASHTEPFAAVIVVPHPADDPAADYVLTAWRTRLRLDAYAPETVRAFLAEFLGRGPEHPVR